MHFSSSPLRLRRTAVGALAAACAIALPAVASAAVSVPPGFKVSQFAAGSGALNKPDDIVQLGGKIYVAFQNGVGPKGESSESGITNSTVIEYSHTGRVVNQWSLTGRVDGMGADRFRHLIYATVNEDANSSFYVIDPKEGPPAQLRHLTYNDPSGAITGGTDAVIVCPNGNILISSSNPAALESNVVATAVVDSPSPGLVTVGKTFAANLAGVSNANIPGTTTTLALTDPDSNAIVPAASPRFAGQFMLDSQADGQLIFAPLPLEASPIASTLSQLTLSVPGQPASPNPVLDDVRWASSDDGVLYVVDQGANTIYEIKGPFQAGQAVGSAPAEPGAPLQTDLVNVDPQSGDLSPFATGMVSPKGLLYVG